MNAAIHSLWPQDSEDFAEKNRGATLIFVVFVVQFPQQHPVIFSPFSVSYFKFKITLSSGGKSRVLYLKLKKFPDRLVARDSLLVFSESVVI